MMPQGEQLEAYDRLQQELEQERQAAAELRQELETLRRTPSTSGSNTESDSRLAELEAELIKAREELMMQLAANEQERETLAAERAQLEHTRAALQAVSTKSTASNAASGELEQDRGEESDAVYSAATNDEHRGVSPAVEYAETPNLSRDISETSTGEESFDCAEGNSAQDNVEEVSEQGEDQIFARLRALTSGKPVPEEKSPGSRLHASFMTDDVEAEADTEEALDEDESKQHPSVKNDLPTNHEDEDDAPQSVPAPVIEQSAPAAEPNEAEDESIDDYMQRLLNRMRGSAEGEGKISNQNQAGKDQHAKEQRMRAEQALRDAADAAPAKPKREYVRTEAPEKKADLAAMRELANSTARTAVQTSRSKMAASQALNKLIIGGGGMVLSAGALMLLAEEDTLLRMGAAVGMILSLSWTAFGLYLSRDILFAKAKRELILAPSDSTIEANEGETSDSPAPVGIAENETM